MKFEIDGWYGIISDDFTFDKIRVASKAVCKYLIAHGLAKKSVVIGYDSGFLSRNYAEIFTEVLVAGGIKCFFSEKPITSSVLLGAQKNYKAAGAVMITSGEKPYFYGGIKFYPDYCGEILSHISMEINRNMKLIEELNEKIESMNFDKAAALEKVEIKDFLAEYQKNVEKNFNFKKSKGKEFKIVVSELGGNISDILKVFVNGKIETLCESFENLWSYKKAENKVKEFKDKIGEISADIGILTDKDAFEVRIYDEKGEEADRNILLGIILEYMIETKGKSGVILKNMAATKIIDDICEKYSLDLVETGYHFKNITEKILKNKVLFALSDRGGVYLNSFPAYRDSLLYVLSLLDIMNKKDMSLSDLIEEFKSSHKTYVYRKFAVKFRDNNYKMIVASRLREFKNLFEEDRIKKETPVEGVKIEFIDNSWIYLRLSPTDSDIEVFIEAKDEEFAKLLEKRAHTFISLN